MRAIFIHAPSDVVFANGAISNGMRAIKGKRSCLASGVPRVSLEAFEGSNIDLEGFSSKKLVDSVFKHPHATVANAYDNKPVNCTGDGLSLRKIDSHLVTAVSSTPSVWLARFTKSDIGHFRRNSFNSWDKGWVRKLIKEDRIRVAGTSSLFFCIELTSDSDKKPMLKKGMLNNDIYRGILSGMEKRVARLFLSVWEGSS